MLKIFTINGLDNVIAGYVIKEDSTRIYLKNMMAVSVIRDENSIYNFIRPYISEQLYYIDDLNDPYILYKSNIVTFRIATDEFKLDYDRQFNILLELFKQTDFEEEEIND